MFSARLAEHLGRTSWSLETERLALLPMVPAHAPALFGVLAEPGLYAFTGGVPPSSVEALAARITGLARLRSPDGAELWLNWTLHLRSTGAVGGYVQATATEEAADLAWVLGTAFQGCGYATEAAQAMKAFLEGLGIRRLQANIKPDHRASQQVAARLGMVRSGDWRDGEEVWHVPQR